MRELPPSDLKACFGRPTWIDIEISNEQELEEIADKLGLSRRVILASSYPHVDKRSSYTKIFAWYPVISLSGKESSYRRLPVILLLNEVSTITVSSSATGLKKRIVEEMGRKTYADFSVSARATIIAMTYLLESHEQHDMLTDLRGSLRDTRSSTLLGPKNCLVMFSTSGKEAPGS